METATTECEASDDLHSNIDMEPLFDGNPVGDHTTSVNVRSTLSNDIDETELATASSNHVHSSTPIAVNEQLGSRTENANMEMESTSTPKLAESPMDQSATSDDLFASPEKSKPFLGAPTKPNNFSESGGMDDDFGGDFDESEATGDVDLFGDKESRNFPERTEAAGEITAEKLNELEEREVTKGNDDEMEDVGGKNVGEKENTESQLPQLNIINADHPDVTLPDEIPFLEPEVAQKVVTDTEENLKDDGAAEKPSSNDEENGVAADTTPSKLPGKRGRPPRRQSSDTSNGLSSQSDHHALVKPTHVNEPNPDLNINSRPRRSIARKSVFELLQVEYRSPPGSGSRKHSAPAAAADNDDEASGVKKTPVKKAAPKSTTTKPRRTSSDDETAATLTKRAVVRKKHDSENENHSDGLTHRIVCYTPDDFDGESSSKKAAEMNRSRIAHKSITDHETRRPLEPQLEKQSLMEIAFNQEADAAAKNFAAEFEAATIDALSEEKPRKDGVESSTEDLERLQSENEQLRARIKALEQSKNSTVKKFNIDFHSRKFSRIRYTPVGGPSSEDRKNLLLGANKMTQGSEQAAIHSRSALLDRREHRLRELDAELDERMATVRVRESAMQRRERKLADLEKTLEYRERVLSRHEQSLQKRELELGSAGVAEQSGTDNRSLVAEMQSRMEQRRLELDRRQTFLDSEREKLAARERALEHREQELALKLEHSQDLMTDDLSAPAAEKKSNSSAEINSKTKKKRKLDSTDMLEKRPVKKIKVVKSPVLASARKVTRRSISVINKREKLSPTASAASATKKKYGLRKRSL